MTSTTNGQKRGSARFLVIDGYHQAGRAELVEIGMPRRDQRNTQVVGRPRAQDSHVAGTRDVNHVGAEGAQGASHAPRVAHEQQIEAHIAFHRK